MNNLPNRLTVLRILIVPFVMICMLCDFAYSGIAAAVLFVLASVTDWLDGYIARKRNLVTNFGKIMDPLADKLLVAAVLLCLVETGVCPSWCAMLIFAREFLVLGMRVVAVAEGIAVQANMWGKVKTVIQFIAMTIAILFANSGIAWLDITVSAGIYLATAATVISGVVYTYDYRKVFK